MVSSVSQTSEQFEFSKCLYVVRPLKAKATMTSEKKTKKNKKQTDRQTKQNKTKARKNTPRLALLKTGYNSFATLQYAESLSSNIKIQPNHFGQI